MDNLSGHDNLKAEALAICRDYLGGPWLEVTSDELKFSEMKGGLSNSLYLCSLPADSPGSPRDVVLRIYGDVQQGRADIVASEAVVFVLLSERGLGPKLYGLFPKGRLEQYIPSHVLSFPEIQQYSCAIARQMAKIHALHVPVRKTPDVLINFAEKWHAEALMNQESAGDSFSMTFDEYGQELEWIKKEMARSTSPVIYCHNDLQAGNVLYREDVAQSKRPDLVLIDFEFAGYNYRGYDFASHFCERCFDYTVEEHPNFRLLPERFPSEREQLEFFSAYVDQLQLETGERVSPRTVMKEVPLFLCVALLIGCLWGVSMVTSTLKTGFGYREYEKARMVLYRKHKEQYLRLCVQEAEQ